MTEHQVKPVEDDSRGIVHPAAAATVFRLDRFPPSGGVGRFVDRYWLSTWRLPPGMRHEQQVLVHPVVNVVFEADGAVVSGVDTGRFAVTLEGERRALGIMFRPAAFAPFFDGPLTALTDQEVPLARVPALADLEALLVPLVADLDVPGEKIAAAADAALADRVPAERQDCETTTEWAELAVQDRELTRVEDLARAAGSVSGLCNAGSPSMSGSGRSGSCGATGCTRPGSGSRTTSRSTGQRWPPTSGTPTSRT